MRSRILSLAVVFLLGTVALFGQEKSEKVKVYGACGMCESRIEKTAKAIDGVTAADWDKETKMLAVTYDSKKTSSDDIEKAVAKVGHDTDKFRAEDKVYAALPGCCHYERPALIKGNK